jgi:HTH-type transcriptional regulator/antitoxin HipB
MVAGGLARPIGVSRKWVYEVEAGKPRTEFGLVLRALRALDLTLRATPQDDHAVDDDTADLSVDLDELLRRVRGDS